MAMAKERHAGGFTYVGLLIMLAIIAVAATATLQLGAIAQRREAEEELLAIGSEFRNALLSYAVATPAGQPTAPQTLDDLLKDPRYPTPRRHLRKLYGDPLTGKAEWGVMHTLDGKGIAGVYSLSTQRPIKIGNFAPEFQTFTGKDTYAGWVFQIASANSLQR
jgi:type II secretory pathway pseudopilin PulG